MRKLKTFAIKDEQGNLVKVIAEQKLYAISLFLEKGYAVTCRDIILVDRKKKK